MLFFSAIFAHNSFSSIICVNQGMYMYALSTKIGKNYGEKTLNRYTAHPINMNNVQVNWFICFNAENN